MKDQLRLFLNNIDFKDKRIIGLLILIIVLPLIVVFVGFQTNLINHASASFATCHTGVCVSGPPPTITINGQTVSTKYTGENCGPIQDGVAQGICVVKDTSYTACPKNPSLNGYTLAPGTASGTPSCAVGQSGCTDDSGRLWCIQSGTPTVSPTPTRVWGTYCSDYTNTSCTVHQNFKTDPGSYICPSGQTEVSQADSSCTLGVCCTTDGKPAQLKPTLTSAPTPTPTTPPGQNTTGVACNIDATYYCQAGACSAGTETPHGDSSTDPNGASSWCANNKDLHGRSGGYCCIFSATSGGSGQPTATPTPAYTSCSGNSFCSYGGCNNGANPNGTCGYNNEGVCCPQTATCPGKCEVGSCPAGTNPGTIAQNDVCLGQGAANVCCL